MYVSGLMADERKNAKSTIEGLQSRLESLCRSHQQPGVYKTGLEGAHQEAERPQREDRPLLASRLTILTDKKKIALQFYLPYYSFVILTDHNCTPRCILGCNDRSDKNWGTSGVKDHVGVLAFHRVR